MSITYYLLQFIHLVGLTVVVYITVEGYNFSNQQSKLFLILPSFMLEPSNMNFLLGLLTGTFLVLCTLVL